MLKPNEGVLPSFFQPRAVMVRSPRFEPGSSAWQSSVVDWNRFRVWIEAKGYHGTYPSTIFNYALRYSGCLLSKDLSEIVDFSEGKRAHVKMVVVD
jgi:hypothetical protein